jgi:hypothetical protein
VLLLTTRSWLGKEDYQLEKRLLPELSGILNLALDGLQRLTVDNENHFTRFAAADEAITIMRDLASPVGAFVREKCKLGSDDEIAVDALYAAYKEWCQICEYPKSSKAVFGRDLRAACPSVKRGRPRDGTSRHYVYAGIRLRTEKDEAEEAEPELPLGGLYNRSGPRTTRTTVTTAAAGNADEMGSGHSGHSGHSKDQPITREGETPTPGEYNNGSVTVTTMTKDRGQGASGPSGPRDKPIVEPTTDGSKNPAREREPATYRGKSDDMPYIGPVVEVPDQGPDPLDAHGAPLAAQDQGTTASMPFMLTKEMKRRLRVCGYSDEQIAHMTPQEAHDILGQLSPGGG